MAIVVDPDVLTRYSTIFVSADQVISVYPTGDTQRGTNAIADCWVSNTSTILGSAGDWASDGVVNGDIICILNGVNGGHWYCNNNVSATELTLAEIDSGTAAAETTSLTVVDSGVFQSANCNFTTNNVNIDAHAYVTGDAVVYDKGAGGTAPTGLTDLTVYYIIWTDANNFRIASSYANALANTGIDLEAGSMAGTAHIFHERIVVGAFNNGASASEQIGGNDTSGDGDGDVLDGITLQAIYSYGKEEWLSDSLGTVVPTGSYNDDLIRHEFPFESITSEQFEVGGGAPHADWNWANEYSRKKVRTGGWAVKTTTSTVNDLTKHTGVVTLGSIDTDAQVYYQQTSATTNPVNFTFLGVVNEQVQVYRDDNQDGSADDDFTTYLKLFLRKKGLTYASSEIADIGVSTIQTIVNRFPLTHATDAAIANTDGEILGVTPWRDGYTVTTQTGDGDITTGGVTFTDTTNDLEALLVVPGDTLNITSGTDIGYYTIASVDDANTLTIATDFEFSGWQSTDAAVNYNVRSYWRTADKTADGLVADFTTGGIDDLTGDTGTFEDLTEANFVSNTVTANDVLWITETGANYGLYRINSVTDADTLIANTADVTWTTIAGTIDYRILTDGMYLEYRNDTVNTHSAATQFVYDDTNATYGNRPTITITGQVWDVSLAAGSMLEVSGSASNDGRYTVYAREGDSNVSLIATDVLVDETDSTPNSTITHSEGFKRVIGANTYAFNWKTLCNDGTLQDVYQFIQHQLRQTTDIDWGEGTARGDITDLLMSYATPTGTSLNNTLDFLNSNDINNLTLQDHSGVNRSYPFTAAGNLNFNQNLQDDADAKYWLFFTNDDAPGDNMGRDYGTDDAILVEDTNDTQITGTIGAAASVAFTYDYDGNIQRGSGSAATDAPVTLVCIGKSTAQFVIATGTISRTTGISITATAALERNYTT